MKKIIIVISALLFIPIVALARPADPSRFPKYEPLLTPRQNEAPDYKNNVDRVEPGTASPSENSDTSQGNNNNTIEPGSAQNGVSQAAAGTQSNTSTRQSGKIWLVIIIVILSAGGLVYVWKRKK